jgi:hypothetical protein
MGTEGRCTPARRAPRLPVADRHRAGVQRRRNQRHYHAVLTAALTDHSPKMIDRAACLPTSAGSWVS